MDIVVTIKQVPKTTDIRIDPVTHTLKREGVPSIINPDDKAALEWALRFKESAGARVTALCMGPLQAEKALREALAMGADRAVLLTDRAFAGSDTLATSRILAAALKKLGFDIIIAGRQAIDGDTAQVGPQVAELLGIPQVTYVSEMEYDQDVWTVTRMFEDRQQRIEVEGKALFTVLSGAVKPRYMSVSGIIEQDSMAVETLAFADIDVDAAGIGLKGSPTRVKATFARQAGTGGEKKELEPKAAAQLIIDMLEQKYYI